MSLPFRNAPRGGELPAGREEMAATPHARPNLGRHRRRAEHARRTAAMASRLRANPTQDTQDAAPPGGIRLRTFAAAPDGED